MAAALDAYSPRIASQIESSPTDTGASAASHATGSGWPAGSSASICASSRPYPSVASPMPSIFTISESASVPSVRHVRTPAHAPARPSSTLPDAYACEIGRAHVGTPVTNAHLVCRLLLEKKQYNKTTTTTDTSINHNIQQTNNTN